MLSVDRPLQGPTDKGPANHPLSVSDIPVSPKEKLIQLERERQALLQRKDRLLDETSEGDDTDNQLLTVLHRLRGVAEEIERVRAVCR